MQLATRRRAYCAWRAESRTARPATACPARPSIRRCAPCGSAARRSGRRARPGDATRRREPWRGHRLEPQPRSRLRPRQRVAGRPTERRLSATCSATSGSGARTTSIPLAGCQDPSLLRRLQHALLRRPAPDDPGRHLVISTGDEASICARFHFRPHFFQHAGFRVVQSDRRRRRRAAGSGRIRRAGSTRTTQVLNDYLLLHYGVGARSRCRIRSGRATRSNSRCVAPAG
ncbi:MAG: hypothetical protein MZW92_81480 [Comamonadaceae bacterium]|nr:hypothetical protein [Comamonadaceae bacterium]